ncbi:molybdenum cofactor guanylyltransferase MobA [Veronia pacifica]|uniref:Molybdenum cofactor guanylyltransferase n=1 Tax=Veronia pacifica TaxID=1080227 RepID=A0A1C3ERJ7_9GAMM|nr:molybdenum cofactor guanylyltransferase MobA [Veronia pacifica]ODA35865.1 molybdenum cofactor guanylyltransferase MobA [Veronia pacifica]
MQSHPDITWVILAGGRAIRMNGQDKGLIKLNEKPLIAYVHEQLSKQGAAITINANRNQDIYHQYGDVFGDVFEGYPGPLGGMHAAMTTLSSDWLGFVPCDCPNLPSTLVDRMQSAIKPDTEIVVAHDGEHVQPVVTLMKRSLFKKLDDFLRGGDRKIVLLYDMCKTEVVDFGDQHDAFINLNTPDELERYGQLS